MKILLVEDSQDFRHKMKELLEDLDYKILEASDGIEGLDLIKTHKDLNLIISDLHMPNLDGLSMCKKLKEENVETAPIMMVTTEANPQLRKDGMEAGVSIWMIKPVSDKKFLTMVEKILNRQ
ncbi:response regulator [Bacteriovoracales bacterium]|nr:response regulator [Bacteriovoracales bacterium]|tara:strand:+ start:4 stop:369 length:366 start_codon:yes stop_codon:yes gene_type:complete